MKKLKGPDVFFFKVLSVILASAIIISTFLGIGLTRNININSNNAGIFTPILQGILYGGNGGTASTPVDAQPQATQPATQPTTQAATQPTTQGNASTDTTTAAPAESTTASGSSTGAISASSSVDEVVAYFNASANKVKTNATSVTRNYEDSSNIAEKNNLPSAVSGIAEGAMGSFLKKDETPVVYGTQQEIIDNYPVRGESWVSQLTADLVESFTVEDDGTNIKITMNMIDDTTVNPTAGTGYGKAFNILKEEEIALDYPGLTISNVQLTYFDGVISCTIDKATGNMIEATYAMPLVLSLTAKIVVKEVDAQIGLRFEQNYTIAY